MQIKERAKRHLIANVKSTTSTIKLAKCDYFWMCHKGMWISLKLRLEATLLKAACCVSWHATWIFWPWIRCSHLISHAGDDGLVPIGGQTCHRLKGKGAGWSNKRDYVVLEVHVRSQSRSPSTRTGWIANINKNLIGGGTSRTHRIRCTNLPFFFSSVMLWGFRKTLLISSKAKSTAGPQRSRSNGESSPIDEPLNLKPTIRALTQMRSHQNANVIDTHCGAHFAHLSVSRKLRRLGFPAPLVHSLL